MTERGARPQAAAAVLTALALLCAAGRAGAATDAEKQAQGLFVEAMKLLASKQYAEACTKLARSQELDPGMGTQFRLAECYEKLGRAAGAFIQYSAVAEAAKAAGKLERAAVARRRAAALEPKVARLTITIPPAVAELPGLEVACDGAPLPAPLWGTPQAVEPGNHLITVRARGKKPWESKVWAESSAKHTVSVGSLEDVHPPVAPPPPPRSLIPVIALGVAGGAGVAVGAVFFHLRAGKAATAQSLHDTLLAEQGNCVNGGMARYAADCTPARERHRRRRHLRLSRAGGLRRGGRRARRRGGVPVLAPGHASGPGGHRLRGRAGPRRRRRGARHPGLVLRYARAMRPSARVGATLLAVVALGLAVLCAWSCTDLGDDCQLNLNCPGMTQPMCSGIFDPGACDTCTQGYCCAELAACYVDQECLDGCLEGFWPPDPDCAAPPSQAPFQAILACTAQFCASACASADNCNPVTNAGCAGTTCDSIYPGVFGCTYNSGVPVGLCEACDNVNAPFCGAGLHCFTGSNTCARFCCTDADCGSGFCDLDQTIDFQSPLPLTMEKVGLCLTLDGGAAACDAPDASPSMGSCAPTF